MTDDHSDEDILAEAQRMQANYWPWSFFIRTTELVVTLTHKYPRRVLVLHLAGWIFATLAALGVYPFVTGLVAFDLVSWTAAAFFLWYVLHPSGVGFFLRMTSPTKTAHEGVMRRVLPVVLWTGLLGQQAVIAYVYWHIVFRIH